MHSFFALTNRLKLIRRWGLMRSAIPENNAEHSLAVAMIAHNLALVDQTLFGSDIDPSQVAVIAMYHDFAEVLVGDMPTPVKYANASIHTAFGQLERLAEERLIEYLPAQLREHYAPILSPDRAGRAWQLVKLADKLAAYVKCIEELASANNEFSAAADTIRADLDTIDDPCLTYFIKNFLDAYHHPLDQLIH